MSSGDLQQLSERVALLELQLADLTSAFNQFRLNSRQPSRSTSEFHLVTSPSRDGAGSVGAGSVASSGYNVLAEEIPTLPDFAARLCSNLTGGSLCGRERARRAWESGWWARFCLEGRLQKPRPSKPCDLANSCYVVLRAEGYDCPLLVTRAADYRAIVKEFKGDSLSHGFASQSEAKVYCLGAGVEFPQRTFQWSQGQ